MCVLDRMRQTYDCTKCPAYCCSYDQIEVRETDIRRLARHLDLDREDFLKRYTKEGDDMPILRHRRDKYFGIACVFLDPQTRQCTVYDARPNVCRTYPDRPRCGYYDFLSWEREFQDDEKTLPLNSLKWAPRRSS